MLIDTSRTPRGGPLAALSKGFAEDLRRQGYAPRTISEHRRLLRDLSDWLERRQLTAGDLSMAQVDRFLSDRRSAGAARHKTRKALGPILGYLRGLEVAPAAETPVGGRPRRGNPAPVPAFLTTERGLAAVTALRYVDCLRPFLDRRMSADGLELGTPDPGRRHLLRGGVVPASERRRGEADGHGAALVPRLSASGRRHGTLARLGRADGRPPPAGRAAQGARARSGAAPSCGMRCPHTRRLPRSGDSDPAGPARPAARRGRRAQARRYRLARGHDQRARQGQLSRTDAPSAGCRSPAGRIPGTRPACGRPGPDRVRPALRAPSRARREPREHASWRMPPGARASGASMRIACAIPRQRSSCAPARPCRRSASCLRHRRAETTAIYAKVDRDSLRLIARPWPEGDR